MKLAKTDYVILTNQNAQELMTEVREYLERDYQLVGGVSVCVWFESIPRDNGSYVESETDQVFAQAVLK